MDNCLIAFKFDAGVKYQNLVSKIVQWLDKHPKGICEDTLYPPIF